LRWVRCKFLSRPRMFLAPAVDSKVQRPVRAASFFTQLTAAFV